MIPLQKNIMKIKNKLIFFVCAFFFFGYSYADPNQDTAYTIADALAAQAIAVNSLSGADFCILNTAMNSGLTDEQILEAIDGNSGIDGIRTILIATQESLANFGAITFIGRNSANASLVKERLYWDLDGTINAGCAAHKAAISSCMWAFAQYNFAAALSCTIFSVFYEVCYLAALIINTGAMNSCCDVADAASPGCAGTTAGGGGGGGPVYHNPLLQSWTEIPNSNCN